MAKSFFIDFRGKCYHFSSKTFFSKIKTSTTKKTWSNICLKCFSHHKYKSLSSSLIEKSIMEDTYFFSLHRFTLKNNQEYMNFYMRIKLAIEFLKAESLNESNKLLISSTLHRIYSPYKTSISIYFTHLINTISWE